MDTCVEPAPRRARRGDMRLLPRCDCANALRYLRYARIVGLAPPARQVDALTLAEEQGRRAGFHEHLDKSPILTGNSRFRSHILARDRVGRPADDHRLGLAKRCFDRRFPW